MEAFPGSFKRATHVGNPVRRSIATLPSPAQRRADRPEGSLRLLVFGGSLGAAALNDIVPQALAALPKNQRPQVWHQTGPKHIELVTNTYAQLPVGARVDAYIDNMEVAYSWADLVLCRAGAMTVAELAAAGVASILVPYPHAWRYQYVNAQYLVRRGVGQLLLDQDLRRAIMCHLSFVDPPKSTCKSRRRQHSAKCELPERADDNT